MTYMMDLNREAEVALHGQAADIEWTLFANNGNHWIMVVEGVKDVVTMEKETRSFDMNAMQAAATMALLIAGDWGVEGNEDDEQFNLALYAEAEKVWKDAPQHLRLIP